MSRPVSPTSLLRPVLAAGLPGASVRRGETEPLPPDVWRSLLGAVRRHRLEGLLTLAITDGLAATDEQWDEALEAHRRAAVLAVELEALLVDLVPGLEGAGLEVRVLKGPAHAHLLYPDPSIRSFGDLDLLLPGDHLDAARSILEARGGRRRFPQPRPGFDARFSKGLAVVLPGGHEIDLHRTLAPGPYGLALPVAALLDRPQPLPVGGTSLRALCVEDQTIHAALHAVLGSAEPNPVALRDLAQVLVEGSGGPAVHAPDVLDRAGAWRVEAPLAVAVRQAGVRLGLPAVHPLQRWALRFEPTTRDRWWLSAYEGRTRSSARQSILALTAIAPWRERAAYATAMAFPTRDPGRAPAATRWRRARRAILAPRSR